MNMEELKFLNAFNAIPGVGAVTLRALRDHFGSFAAAWRAADAAYGSAHLDSQAHASLLAGKKSVDPDREMQKLARGDIWTITDEDPEYPAHLKEIFSPPVALYGRGNKNIFQTKSSGRPNLENALFIAVVGTRRPTPYGMEAAETITAGLAAAEICVISGLAVGIDAKAHGSALRERGATVAVLGSGIDPDSIFPPENRGLAERIASAGGAVISEYSPGTPAVKEHFPMRNRIVSGLARGTLVVEAREKSGALITARLALEQNRDVFAVPGSIFSPTSAGPNTLIREGAKPVRHAADIMEEYGMEVEAATQRREREIQALTREESALLDILADPADVDTIRTKTGLPIQTLLSALSLLELKGLVRNLGADIFQKI